MGDRTALGTIDFDLSRRLNMAPTSSSNRTPAAKPGDALQAANDGRDNSTSADPDVRATTEPNITEGGKIATHKDHLASDRPGFHCGYCGEPVGPEGQHWDADGEAKENAHAGTLVVADNWPELQDDQDRAKNEKADTTDTASGLTEK